MTEAEMVSADNTFGSAPDIQFSSQTAPQELMVKVLSQGDGPVVQKGDEITVNYEGVVWGSDVPFDSSFNRGEPATFAIGVGQVIKGWDEALVGKHVNSRLLISIPSDLAYGSRGIPQAGIMGGDTLVFVVDIIATRS